MKEVVLLLFLHGDCTSKDNPFIHVSQSPPVGAPQKVIWHRFNFYRKKAFLPCKRYTYLVATKYSTFFPKNYLPSWGKKIILGGKGTNVFRHLCINDLTEEIKAKANEAYTRACTITLLTSQRWGISQEKKRSKKKTMSTQLTSVDSNASNRGLFFVLPDNCGLAYCLHKVSSSSG